MAGKVDLKAAQKARDEKQKGQDLYKFKEGDTLAYICPPWFKGENDKGEVVEDNLPFVEVMVNYGLGESGKQMALTLDLDRNKVMEHPALAAYIKAQGKDTSGGDPIAELIATGGVEEERAKRIKSQTKYLWNIVPLKHRANTTSKWADIDPAVQPILVGYQLWDQILDIFGGEGDITDPEKAILVRINRKGNGATDTRYQAQPDSQSIREPIALDDELRAKLDEALKSGGTGDLYKMLSGMTKSRSEVAKLASGIAVDEDDKGSKVEGAPEGAPSCFGVDIADTDPECQACPVKSECATVVGVEVPPDPGAKKVAPVVKAPVKAAAPVVKAPVKAVAPPAKKAPPPPPEPEPEEAVEEAAAEGIEAGKCELEGVYVLPDGQVGSYVGPAKGQSAFQTETGLVKLPPSTLVVAAAPSEEASQDATASEEPADETPAAAVEEEEDPALAEMEAKLKAKGKAKK